MISTILIILFILWWIGCGFCTSILWWYESDSIDLFELLDSIIFGPVGLIISAICCKKDWEIGNYICNDLPNKLYSKIFK